MPPRQRQRRLFSRISGTADTRPVIVACAEIVPRPGLVHLWRRLSQRLQGCTCRVLVQRGCRMEGPPSGFLRCRGERGLRQASRRSLRQRQARRTVRRQSTRRFHAAFLAVILPLFGSPAGTGAGSARRCWRRCLVRPAMARRHSSRRRDVDGVSQMFVRANFLRPMTPAMGWAGIVNAGRSSAAALALLVGQWRPAT